MTPLRNLKKEIQMKIERELKEGNVQPVLVPLAERQATFPPIHPVQMLVIGGIYLVNGKQFILIESAVGSDPVVTDIKRTATWSVRLEDLAGPTHVPCPFCGKLQILHAEGLQIDLEEHIMRCRISRKPKK